MWIDSLAFIVDFSKTALKNLAIFGILNKNRVLTLFFQRLGEEER